MTSGLFVLFITLVVQHIFAFTARIGPTNQELLTTKFENNSNEFKETGEINSKTRNSLDANTKLSIDTEQGNNTLESLGVFSGNNTQRQVDKSSQEIGSSILLKSILPTSSTNKNVGIDHHKSEENKNKSYLKILPKSFKQNKKNSDSILQNINDKIMVKYNKKKANVLKENTKKNNNSMKITNEKINLESYPKNNNNNISSKFIYFINQPMNSSAKSIAEYILKTGNEKQAVITLNDIFQHELISQDKLLNLLVQVEDNLKALREGKGISSNQNNVSLNQFNTTFYRTTNFSNQDLSLDILKPEEWIDVDVEESKEKTPSRKESKQEKFSLLKIKNDNKSKKLDEIKEEENALQSVEMSNMMMKLYNIENDIERSALEEIIFVLARQLFMFSCEHVTTVHNSQLDQLYINNITIFNILQPTFQNMYVPHYVKDKLIEIMRAAQAEVSLLNQTT